MVRNLRTNITERIAIDIGFYNSSLGGCTPGVGTWEDNERLQTADQARLRREEYEYGMDNPNFIDNSDFACDPQKSGAYIFRPNNTMVWPASCTSGNCWKEPTITANTGNLLSEVYIAYADWATLIVRLVKGINRIEVEYTVGPIPQPNFEDGPIYLQGKEVVLRYNTSLETDGQFYADSNAREMVLREYNKRGPAYPNPYQISEPAASNYYPVNVLIALEDKNRDIGFSVAVDRSMGGSSLASGSLELMVHRRTQVRLIHSLHVSLLAPLVGLFIK